VRVQSEPKVAFQVLLPVSLLKAVRKHCHEAQVNSMGGFIRQLLAAELAKPRASGCHFSPSEDGPYCSVHGADCPSLVSSERR
jgi:hypothetical protein